MSTGPWCRKKTQKLTEKQKHGASSQLAFTNRPHNSDFVLEKLEMRTFGDRLGNLAIVNVKSVIAKGLWYFLPLLPVVSLSLLMCFFLLIC